MHWHITHSLESDDFWTYPELISDWSIRNFKVLIFLKFLYSVIKLVLLRRRPRVSYFTFTEVITYVAHIHFKTGKLFSRVVMVLGLMSWAIGVRVCLSLCSSSVQVLLICWSRAQHLRTPNGCAPRPHLLSSCTFTFVFATHNSRLHAYNTSKHLYYTTDTVTHLPL